MTTPAVNIVMEQLFKGYSCLVRNDGTRYQFQDWYPCSARYYSEFRPASVNSPKTASGWRYPTAFYHSGTSWAMALNVVRRRLNGSAREEFGDNAAWTRTKLPIPSVSANMANSAVTKALLKLKDQKIDLSNAFGERKETARLATDAFERIGSSIRNLKLKHGLRGPGILNVSPSDLRAATRKQNRDIRRKLGYDLGRSHPLSERNTHQLLNDYLAVQYGVKPLMQDVYGASSALNEREKDGDAYRATVKAVVRDQQRYTDKKTWQNYTRAFYTADVQVDRSVFVRLDYIMDNPLLASLASLGITNPAASAWELTRLSFVVDWFLGIGNYLSAFDAALGWDFLAGSQTKMVRLVAYSPTAQPWNSGCEVVSSGPVSQRSFSFSRSVYVDSPWPGLPVLKNPLSGLHVANAIALIAVKLRS